MLTNYESDLSNSLEQSLPSGVTFEFSASEEERFAINFNKSFKPCDIQFQTIGTEARVSCLLEIDKLEEVIKERILAMLAFDACKLNRENANKYRFTLWSGEKDLKSIPTIEKLKNKESLVLELSSRPCQIHKADLAYKQILKILTVFNSWLESDVLEVTAYIVEETSEEEGFSYEVLTTRHERSKLNRDICIKYHGWNCKVCSVNLQDVYGDRAKCFIHVHHIEKLADLGVKVIDPVNELIPVCPNCHSIIHRTKEPASPEEIERLVMENKRK
jgi:predicted HNH restriction endonuclease